MPDYAQEMLDGICEAVLAAVKGGETRVHVTLTREVPQAGSSVRTEFVNIEGFKCAGGLCGRPFHVRVYGQGAGYEYPVGS